MEFFNPKEEVIRFQFTEYGKQRASEGFFEPEHFVPRDLKVLYDRAKTEEEFLSFVQEEYPIIKKNDIEFGVFDEENLDSSFSVCSILEDLDEEGLNLESPRGQVSVGGVLVYSSDKTKEGIDIQLEDLFLFKKEIRQEEIPNESEMEDTNIRRIDGKYYEIRDGEIFLDVLEDGVDFNRENFDVFLYEVVENRLENIFLYGKTKNKEIFEEEKIIEEAHGEISVLVDYEIDKSLLCKYKEVSKDNNKDNIYFIDDGLLYVGDGGVVCEDKAKKKPFVYFNRKEGILGDGCFDDEV